MTGKLLTELIGTFFLVLTIGLTGVIALLVTTTDRVLKHLRSVRARVVIVATAVVAIVVDQIIVVTRLLQTELVGTDAIPVTLLITQVCTTTLTLELPLTLKLDLLPVSPTVVVLLPTLLLKLLLLSSVVCLVTTVSGSRPVTGLVLYATVLLLRPNLLLTL